MPDCAHAHCLAGDLTACAQEPPPPSPQQNRWDDQDQWEQEEEVRRSKARDRAAEETKRHEATRKRLADAKRFRQEEAERQEELRMKEQEAWDRAAQRRRDRVHAEGGGPPPTPPPPTRPDAGRAAKGGAGGAMTMRGWLGAARLVRARPPVTGSRRHEPPLTTGAWGAGFVPRRFCRPRGGGHCGFQGCDGRRPRCDRAEEDREEPLQEGAHLRRVRVPLRMNCDWPRSAGRGRVRVFVASLVLVPR